MFLRPRNRPFVCFLLFLSFLMTAGLLFIKVEDGLAQSQKPGEYQVKAAFLFNFAKFVEWQKDETLETLTLCMLGEDPFGTILDELQGKTIRGKRLALQRIKSLKNLGEGIILFISASEKNNLQQILQTLKGSNTLTIGDTEGFAQKGVMINFYIEQNKVRFEINSEAARRSGLRISSSLLKLARIVEDAP